MNKNKYVFSVITPFHNVDKDMFDRAATYMERQTIGFSNIEWIIVCHNCDEEHINAVKDRVGSHKNVVIKEISNDIHTPSSPRNCGLDCASADYIGFLDGDDNYRVNTVEKILEVFDHTAADMIVFRREYTLQNEHMTALPETVSWNQTYDEIVITKKDGQDYSTYHDLPFFITSRAYDRRFLMEHQIRFDESITLAEDCYFNLEVIRHAAKICLCPQLIGYNYYINETSILSAPKSDEEILTMIDSALKIIKRVFDYGMYANTIIKVLCFSIARYALLPQVSYEVKLKMKERLEDYLNMTAPIPDGRFPEPINTLMNTLPQQFFASMKQDSLLGRAEDGLPALMRILARNKNTDYGRRYFFKDIHSARGYQSQVPLSDYSTYEPLIDLRISTQSGNIFTADPLINYARNNTGRYLPVVTEQLKEYVRCFTQILTGRNVFLWYKNTNVNEKFNDGVPVNTVFKMSLAGYLDSYRYSGREAPVAFTSPECVYFQNTPNLEDTEYVHALLALANRDVDQLICTYASEAGIMFGFMKEHVESLCSDIEKGEVSPDIQITDFQRRLIRAYLQPDPERAKEVCAILSDQSMKGIAKKLWPGLRNVTCIATGMQSRFKKRLHTFFDGVSHSNGYLGSFAGVFGEAIEGTDQYRLLTHLNFYEFLEKGKENETPVFISGTQVGRTYTLIVSTLSGLFRYNTGLSVKIIDKDPANTILEVIE